MNPDSKHNTDPEDRFRRLRAPMNVNGSALRGRLPARDASSTGTSETRPLKQSIETPMPALEIVRTVAHSLRFVAFKCIEESPPAVREVGFHVKHYPEMNAGELLTAATRSVYFLEAEMQKRRGISEEQVSFRSAAGTLQAILHTFVRQAREQGVTDNVPAPAADEFRRGALQLRIQLNDFLVQLDSALLGVIAARRAAREHGNN